MNRKQFIEAFGATCENWTWSWSFVNHDERYVIFGYWDEFESDGLAKIMDDSWEIRNDRVQPGYSQALRHLRLVENEGFDLRIFRQFRDPDGESDSETPKIFDFERRLTPATLSVEGDIWIANFDLAHPGIRPPKKRNPPWTRDELILALAFYERCKGNPPAQRSKEIANLSRNINRVAEIYGLGGDGRFRNANGVYMKLMNFRNFDSNFDGVGLSRVGKLDEKIWNEFANSRAQLFRAEKQILNALADPENADVPDIDDEEAEEGSVSYRLHKSRERNRKIVELKKARVLQKTGRLNCEACGFDFLQFYGARGEAFIECHHEKPVSELVPGERTKLSDLRLVCSNCHRMIHRRKPMLTVLELKELIVKLNA